MRVSRGHGSAAIRRVIHVPVLIEVVIHQRIAFVGCSKLLGEFAALVVDFTSKLARLRLEEF